MKKILQLVLALTAISAVCAAVLALVNDITKGRIASLVAAKTTRAAADVLPGAQTFETRPDPADTNLTATIGYADAAKAVDQLRDLSVEVDIPATVKLMKAIVPEYISNNSKFEEFDKK